jgi:hypothetical protein
MTANIASAQNVGLFLVRYHVGTGMPGAPMLALGLTVNVVDRTINGAGRLTQAISPPLDLRMNVHGTYVQLPLPPHPGIAAHLTGYPALHWPHHGGIGPVLPPDLDLHMYLDSDFQGGTASYRYRAPNGEWIEVNGVPVRKE